MRRLQPRSINVMAALTWLILLGLVLQSAGCADVEVSSDPTYNFGAYKNKCFALTRDTQIVKQKDGTYDIVTHSVDGVDKKDDPEPTPAQFKEGYRLLPRGEHIRVTGLMKHPPSGIVWSYGVILSGSYAGQQIDGLDDLIREDFHADGWKWDMHRLEPCREAEAATRGATGE